MLTKGEKQSAIEAVKLSDNDTGSSAVQVSILTKRIESLNEHLKTNKKDRHSRRGLIHLIEQRRKHLAFLKRRNADAYEQTKQAVGLRK